MKSIILTFAAILVVSFAQGQTSLPPSKVNFDEFLKLAQEVQKHRKDRVIHLKKWLKMSKEPNTIILDTRSKKMYDAKHIKGAVHLNFADFNMESLAKIIPNNNTKILIYCNNNIANEPIFFATKAFKPVPITKLEPIPNLNAPKNEKPASGNAKVKNIPPPLDTKRTLALNVPTFINLYGYGYKNVFELADLISSNSGIIEFEGSAVKKTR